MKILLTGCAGFIGSHILNRLLSMGHAVIGVDNLSAGHMNNIYAATKDFDKNDLDRRFVFFCESVSDLPKLKTIFAENKPTAVCHQAALGSVPRSIAEPVATLDANLIGTINILECARLSELKRVVYASSSSVYGDSPYDFKIEGEEFEPMSPYAASKVCCETMAKIYASTFGLETIGLRYFNVFGPRQRADGAYAAVIPKMIDAALRSRAFEIHGDGLQMRDFTYVENVVQANLQALITDSNSTFGRAFNVGCQETTSINALLQMITELCQVGPSEIIFKPKRNGDVRNSQADLCCAKTYLRYKPTVGLKEGLIKTIWSYKNENTL